MTEEERSELLQGIRVRDAVGIKAEISFHNMFKNRNKLRDDGTMKACANWSAKKMADFVIEWEKATSRVLRGLK